MKSRDRIAGLSAEDRAEFAPGYIDKVERRTIAADFLTNLQVNGHTPFLTSADAVGDILRQIAGMTTLLQAAFVDCDSLERKRQADDADTLMGMYPVYIARTFEAINTLTAMALFFDEARS